MGKKWKQWQTLFSCAPKSLQMVTAAMKLRHLLLGRKAMTDLDSILKSRDITLPAKVCLVKAMVFFSVVMYRCELDHKEDWVLKNWCFWTVVLEKTLESPLDRKEIKPVNLKGKKRKKVKLLSHVWLFVTPWTVASHGPPSMEFSRQEYWSGFPFPSPGDLSDPGI